MDIKESKLIHEYYLPLPNSSIEDARVILKNSSTLAIDRRGYGLPVSFNRVRRASFFRDGHPSALTLSLDDMELLLSGEKISVEEEYSHITVHPGAPPPFSIEI